MQSILLQVDVLVLPSLSDFEGAKYAPPKSRSEAATALPMCPPTPTLGDEESSEPTPEPAPATPPVVEAESAASIEPKDAISAEHEDVASMASESNPSAASLRSVNGWFCSSLICDWVIRLPLRDHLVAQTCQIAYAFFSVRLTCKTYSEAASAPDPPPVQAPKGDSPSPYESRSTINCMPVWLIFYCRVHAVSFAQLVIGIICECSSETPPCCCQFVSAAFSAIPSARAIATIPSARAKGRGGWL